MPSDPQTTKSTWQLANIIAGKIYPGDKDISRFEEMRGLLLDYADSVVILTLNEIREKLHD